MTKGGERIMVMAGPEMIGVAGEKTTATGRTMIMTMTTIMTTTTTTRTRPVTVAGR
jgi:hypothetical protein